MVGLCCSGIVGEGEPVPKVVNVTWRHAVTGRIGVRLRRRLAVLPRREPVRGRRPARVGVGLRLRLHRQLHVVRHVGEGLPCGRHTPRETAVKNPAITQGAGSKLETKNVSLLFAQTCLLPLGEALPSYLL